MSIKGKSVKHAVGIVTVVQEGRFRLAREDGSSELFILHHGAPLEPQDLEPIAASQMRVEVVYEDAPGVVARLAHDILPAAPARTSAAAPNSQTSRRPSP